MTNNAITWGQRAKVSIAHGALTNSKRPESFVSGVYPTHLLRGAGCYVWDHFGKSYIDFICALGTNLLGYGNESVRYAVDKQMSRGALLSLSSTLEVEFAERVKNYFPFIDRIRVLKTGTEGCMAAIRMARAATGRDLVLSEGYHGWSDTFTILTPPANGCPQGLRYDIDQLSDEKIKRAACVIVEPVITDWSDARIQWLRELREKCTREGAVLIFDETITALRWPKMSVAKWSGIYPDLIVFGKALANGLPISVVGGKREVMEADYFVSGSFCGDMLAMGAAMEVLPMVNESIQNIWEDAAMFQEKFNAAGKGAVWIEGYPTRGVIRGTSEVTRALFMQEACKAGLLFGPSFFWCQPHQSEVATVIDLVEKVISKINSGQAKLEGAMPQQPYAQRVREQ